MKILIPREACPSAIASSLSSESSGENAIAPSALIGTATTAARAVTSPPSRGLHFDVAV